MTPLDPNNQQVDAERGELDRVVEALARWPRLSQLLRYMGESLFSGKADTLNEYNIATDVLGRSKTKFNAGEDAIARVETHRLRKRLTEFYEKEGKDHPIQVALPPGSYVPVFIHKPAGGLISPVSADISSASQSDLYRKNKRAVWLARYWKYAVFAASLALVASGIFLYLHKGTASKSLRPDRGLDPTSDFAVLQPEKPSAELRLLAGYSGTPRIDSAGKTWNPDQYFSGGGSWQRDPGFIARTSDPFIFEHSRTGDFSYSIPLKPGFYELHLFFSTPAKANESSSFNVGINEAFPLMGFDINEDALGENIADERVFRDVVPGRDGLLRLQFVGATGVPSLNAIEILPGVPHAQLPIRVIMQGAPIIDRKGRLWHSDNYEMHGRLSQTHPLPRSPDPDLFAGERYGHFTYAIPVDTRGRYTLVLHFVEFYFGSGSQGSRGVGSRIFKVMCNGQTLLEDFDIYKEVGSLNEVTKTFRHIKPSALGKLNLTFEPIVNNATVSGIEVLDESQ